MVMHGVLDREYTTGFSLSAVLNRAYTRGMAHILVVDDNEQNAYMLRVLLESHGDRVTLASHGVEALERAVADPPDLVITDILMPVMDGFALCRRWKADPLLASRPLVFYTATYTDARDEEFATGLGADAFLIKPQDPDRILRVIAGLLSGPTLDAGLGSAETEFLRRHNESLFHKLEKKVADLAEAQAALERDFALRRDLERQLFQAQKMESLGQIAGGLVHDFNNVLTAIGGIASLLQLQEAEDPAKVREWGQRIQEAVRMGSGLNQQLLAFARQQDLSLGDVDLNSLLESTLAVLRTPGTGVDLTFRPGQAVPVVRADAVQLQRVVVNLVSNARDAMGSSGSITVDTAVMDFDEGFVQHKGSRAGRYVRLRFQDTGTGIAPEVLDKIFDPLFTTKQAGRGTGLGLSVVHGIVHQHGGFLQVTSLPGRGSCFEVYLPESGGR